MLKRLTLLLVLLAPVPVNATSWLVMKDGTGDYTEIQAAVDGCAVGDTVWVGPGRYDTFGQHWPHLNWIEIVGVTVDSLTIKALYPNTAIIGPESPVKVASQKDTEKWVTTIGIGTGLTNTWLVVEDLVFENMIIGIALYPSGEVRRCRFNDLYDVGVLVSNGYDLLIEDCVTSNCGTVGIYVVMLDYSAPAKAIIRNCTSYDDYTGFASKHPNVEYLNCRAIRPRGGFSIYSGNATMDHCSVSNGFQGLAIVGLGALTMTDCVIIGSEYRDIMLVNAYLYGSGNILYGGGVSETIRVANGSAIFTDNHIYPSEKGTINVDYHYSPGVPLDFTNTYWGTSEPDSIAAWIWDGVDEPALGITVNYIPYLSQPPVSVVESDIPKVASSLEVYPNPFNPQTTVRFTLAEPQQAEVSVYDLLGRRIRTLFEGYASGAQTVDWDGRDTTGQAMSSGSYFIRLNGEQINLVRKVMLIR